MPNATRNWVVIKVAFGFAMKHAEECDWSDMGFAPPNITGEMSLGPSKWSDKESAWTVQYFLDQVLNNKCGRHFDHQRHGHALYLFNHNEGPRDISPVMLGDIKPIIWTQVREHGVGKTHLETLLRLL